jgi:O-acetyl-ADP-ribose deacetylase (regulator of RNase III)
VQIENTSIEVVRGSVLDQDVDAIVNAANTAMRGGGGVDGAIHRAAGKGLLAELQHVAPSGAKTGTVVVTGGHQLRHPFIFHTPGPVWRGGDTGEPELLAACYRGCLDAAAARKLASIAFCSISTGVYGYPIERAAPIALETIVAFLHDNRETMLRRIVLAMFGDVEYGVFSEELQKVAGRTF